ncbi:N-acetyltransferase [Spirochaetia bacterium]|nr:N-acetyltransferase [Spirochaetia bacterium]
MSKRTTVTLNNGKILFDIEILANDDPVSRFDCPISEYNDYLTQEALRSQNDHIALTWLLRDKADKGIAAYMSLIADAIKLSVNEKELHSLDYPFKTVPAIKIAKLAVSAAYQEKYKGVGTFMIETALAMAQLCNKTLFACRFITVDADVEHNESVLSFYRKNGFLINEELFNKHRKNISMRRDIYLQ